MNSEGEGQAELLLYEKAMSLLSETWKCSDSCTPQAL